MGQKQSHTKRINDRASERASESFHMQTYSPTDIHIPMIILVIEMQDGDDDGSGEKKNNEKFRIFQSFFFK